MDSISLTLHLQYCVSRLYPDLAQYFSVSLPLGSTEEQGSGKTSPTLMEDEAHDLKSERVLLIEEIEGSGKSTTHDPGLPQNTAYPSFSLTKAGIPALQVHYQVRRSCILLTYRSGISPVRQVNLIKEIAVTWSDSLKGRCLAD